MLACVCVCARFIHILASKLECEFQVCLNPCDPQILSVHSSSSLSCCFLLPSPFSPLSHTPTPVFIASFLLPPSLPASVTPLSSVYRSQRTCDTAAQTVTQGHQPQLPWLLLLLPWPWRQSKIHLTSSCCSLACLSLPSGLVLASCSAVIRMNRLYHTLVISK